MSENLGNGTAKGLMDYLDSLVTKGRVRSGVITPLKTSAVKILEATEGENWGNIDITRLDVDDAVSRFKNLTMSSGKYTQASYQAYDGRLKRAIKWYNNFLQNPGWFPKEEPRASLSQESSKVAKKKTTLTNTKAPEMITEEAQPTIQRIIEAPRIDSIAYPFPLSNGETARIFMPKGITKSDVKRLSTFLDALVISEE